MLTHFNKTVFGRFSFYQNHYIWVAFVKTTAMIELPEALNLAKQINEQLKGRTVTDVFPPSYVHKFTFFHGDPAEYNELLASRKVIGAEGYGIFVNMLFEGGVTLSFHDGASPHYEKPGAKIPEKYQLLIAFDDGSFMWFSVAMYGGIALYEGDWNNQYHRTSLESVSPLDDSYDFAMFIALIDGEKKNISAKALLATEQRIPGVGNGVLQDILFNAAIHPKRKIQSLSESERKALYDSLKSTLAAMAAKGGRDTETDLTGNKGGYVSVLSKNTLGHPCPRCGATIMKEPYMGGAVYFCPGCQKQ